MIMMLLRAQKDTDDVSRIFLLAPNCRVAFPSANYLHIKHKQSKLAAGGSGQKSISIIGLHSSSNQHGSG